ncbi:type I-E CRISPR-associated protein Cas6/Cse3/CasE [Streptomyces sp. NPDC005538]|uniref:type I-E CRISPR-associated protein Cas6/Cse3/CasE n=1 Tax=Streptomyces sp. NPDC005538 TaxID=3157043 RepID=UPI0033AF1500
MTSPVADTPPPAQHESGFSAWRYALSLSPGEQRRCLDVQRLHQLVLQGWRPPHLRTAVPAPAPRVLYAARRIPPAREEGTGHRVAGRPITLLVQASAPADWQPLLDSRILTGARSRQVLHTFAHGERVTVRVIANPSKKIPRKAGRTSLRTPEECGAWLRRHLNDALSIQPHDVLVSDAERLTGKSGTLTFPCRELQASGTVQDPAALYAALAQGIGPTRAYGCGLLRIHTAN